MSYQRSKIVTVCRQQLHHYHPSYHHTQCPIYWRYIFQSGLQIQLYHLQVLHRNHDTLWTGVCM